MRIRGLAGRLLAAAAAPLLLAAVITGFGPAAGASAAACQPWAGGLPPSPGNFNDELDGVAMVSTCDVWAVGSQSSLNNVPGRPLIDHWTGGSSWTAVPSPSLGSAGGTLSAATAVSATDIWAVGQSFVAGKDQTLIEHWNGSSWTRVPSPSPGADGADLSAVTAVSANDVWAAGAAFDSSSRPQALIEHWNGSAWIQAPVPSLPGSFARLWGVAATSANDVWAVGALAGQTLTLHWDGASWTLVPSPSPGPVGSTLSSVTAISATNAWAVGQAFDEATTTVLHWDGTAWAQQQSDSPGNSPGGFNILNGVVATGTGQAIDAWAVGSFSDTGDTSDRQSLVLHLTGEGWTQVRGPSPGAETNLFAVADTTGSVWMAGRFANDASADQTRAFAAPLQGIVPNVAGDTVDAATGVLQSAGYAAGSVTNTTDCSVPDNGLVVDTAPAAGVPAPLGSQVTLFVCHIVVTMPNLLSLDEASAENIITGIGLTVGDISLDNRCLDVAGTVLTQNPTAGAQVLKGSPVNLTVSSGVDSAGKPCILK